MNNFKNKIIQAGNLIVRLGSAMMVVLACLSPITPNAQAQITFKAVSTAKLTTTSISSHVNQGPIATAASGNVTVNATTNRLPGDLMLIVVESRDNVPSTMPSGWNLLNEGSGAGGLHRMSVFWKFASSNSEAPPTVTHTGGGRIIARMFIFRGVDPDAPFDTTPSFNGSSAGLITTADSITTSNPSFLVFFAGVGSSSSGNGNLTGSSPWIARALSSAGTESDGVSIQYFTSTAMRSPGTQNALTLTRITGNAESHGIQIALRPNTKLKVDKPAGTAANDTLIASLVYRSNTVVDAAPTNWTLLRRTQNSDTVHAVYWRTASASEPVQYSWTFGTTTGAAIALQAFSGADPTAPIDVEAGQTTPAAYLHSTPGITTTTSNTMLVASFASKSSGPWAPPSGMTEISDQATAGQNAGVSLETTYQSQSASGWVGVKTANATNNFVPEPGHTHILALRPASQAPRIYFLHTDHLNTPRLITSDTGQAVWSWANDDPYGNNAPNENPSGAGNFTCNLRLPGQYFDAELNTHYNYFRDFDPSTGRYVQSDPIGLPGGLNTYTYANSSPINLSDPTGKCPSCVGAILGVGGDAIIQIGIGTSNGQTIGEAISNINITQSIVAAGAGASGIGAITVARDLIKAAPTLTAALGSAESKAAAELFVRAQAAIVAALAKNDLGEKFPIRPLQNKNTEQCK